MKRDLKWQLALANYTDIGYNERFVRHFVFGIFKFTKLPHEGESVHKHLYKGFILRICYWWPIYLERG